jgi:hypothetical protein
MILNEKVINYKVVDFIEYITLVFTLSPFNIVNHLKSDQGTYTEYLEL